MSLSFIALLFGACVAIIYFIKTVLPLDRLPFKGKKMDEIQKQIEQDAMELGPVLQSMEEAIHRLEEMRPIFDAKTMNEVNEQKKQALLDVWAVFLDHQVALGQVVERYQYFYQLSYARLRGLHARAFFLGYAAFVVAYASGLRLIALVQDRPLFDLILNDLDERRGIPRHAYDALSARVIHVDGALRLTAGYQNYQFLKPVLSKEDFLKTHAYIVDAIEKAFIFALSRVEERAGEWLPRNGWRMFGKAVLRSVFPVQKTIAQAMGHARVGVRKHFFITPEQIDEMKKAMQPGDILLERRNWYLSNVGIPGFWPHAALYLGTCQEFIEFFSVPEVQSYLDEAGWRDLPEALRSIHADFFAVYGENGFHVLEAKAEGVILTALSESAKADYVAVIRPNVSRVEICKALLEAIRHYGKPYDYGFDFVTDSSLVCSELVYKAYKTALTLPLTSHAGRLIITATTFAQLCDEDRAVDRPRFRYVSFLDAREKEGKAFFSTEEAFCNTWRRPKWDISQE